MLQHMLKAKHTSLGLWMLLALLFASCSNGSAPAQPGIPTSFQYKVPDDIESAWLITHDEQGNIIASKALSGSGTATLNAKGDGLVTLAIKDTWSENGEQKQVFHLRSYPVSAAQDKVLTNLYSLALVKTAKLKDHHYSGYMSRGRNPHCGAGKARNMVQNV